MAGNKKKRNIGGAFGYGGPVFTWGSKLFDLMLVSIYWVIGSIPVVTVGASASAIYYAVHKSVIEDRSSISESFWHSYRDSLKMGCGHWLVSAGLGFLFLWSFGIFRANMSGMPQWFFCALYLVLFCALVMNCCYLFPMISRYRMPFGWYTRGSVFCVFRYFPSSLALLGLLGVGYYSVYRFPLLIIFIPGMYTYISTIFVEKRITQFAGDDRPAKEQD